MAHKDKKWDSICIGIGATFIVTIDIHGINHKTKLRIFARPIMKFL